MIIDMVFFQPQWTVQKKLLQFIGISSFENRIFFAIVVDWSHLIQISFADFSVLFCYSKLIEMKLWQHRHPFEKNMDIRNKSQHINSFEVERNREIFTLHDKSFENLTNGWQGDNSLWNPSLYTV